MPVSGLVVVLSTQPALRAAALAAIGRDVRLEIGEREGNRVAVVADTESSEMDKEVWNALHALPGVLAVEVAFVAFEDDHAPSAIPTEDAAHQTTSISPRIDGESHGR